MKVVLAYSGGLDTSVILAWLGRRERMSSPIPPSRTGGCGRRGQGEGLETGASEPSSKTFVALLHGAVSQLFALRLSMKATT